MSLTLNISSQELDEEDLHQLTNDVCETINYETDLTADLAIEEGVAGAKGDTSILGQVILTAFSSGAIGSIMDVFKAYVSREKSLSIEIKTESGKSIKVNSTNISSDELKTTLSEITSLVQ